MAMALRPRASAASMSSWKGSQALADGLRVGCGSLGSATQSVVTSMAGFAGARSVVVLRAGLAAAESVVTSMAGFAVVRPPGLPGADTGTPAALRYAAAVSRRTPVSR